MKVAGQMVLGAISNLVWGFIWELLSPTPSTGSVVDSALKDAGSKSNDMIGKILSAAAQPLAEWTLTRSQIIHAADLATTVEDLDELAAWINAEAANVRSTNADNSDALAKDLLALWVRERAGDGIEPRGDVNADSYQDAKKASEIELDGDGRIRDRRLYAHQLRFHLLELGLAPEEAIGALDRAVDHIVAQTGDFDPESRNHRAILRWRIKEWSYVFRDAEPERWHGRGTAPSRDGSSVTMSVRLEASGDAIYLDEVRFANDDAGASDPSPRSWSWSP